MFNNQANPLNPSASSSQGPPQLDDQPSLEEIAEQMKQINAVPGDQNPIQLINPPVLTAAEDIPSSGIPATPPPVTEPAKDAISQLDDLNNSPAANSGLSIGQKIAQSLADNEVIGEHQIEEVASVLTPELVETLTGPSSSPDIPISVTNPDGTNFTIRVPAKEIFEFLSGRRDLIHAAKT